MCSNVFEIEQQFYDIMKPIYTEENLENINKKYYNLNDMFFRFYSYLQGIKHERGRNGLDFGCGCGATSVIGKLLGLNIMGLDRKADENQYIKIQKALCDIGYLIINCDTNIYPWDSFENDQFDYICSYWGVSQLLNFPEILWYKPEWYALLMVRCKELARITKPGGRWYFYPCMNKNVMEKLYKEIQTKPIIVNHWIKKRYKKAAIISTTAII